MTGPRATTVNIGLTVISTYILFALYLLILFYFGFFLQITTSKLAKSKISIFYLVSVAEETGLSLAFSETQKIGFVASRPVFV